MLIFLILSSHGADHRRGLDAFLLPTVLQRYLAVNFICIFGKQTDSGLLSFQKKFS